MPKTIAKLTGMSLSFCISDICLGLVEEANVETIITGTNAPDLATFEKVLSSYCETYWSDFPQKAREIAMRLWKGGKIDQPRTRGEACYSVAQGHWMNKDRQLVRVQ